MPVYTYRCDNCGNETDERRSVDDRNNATGCNICQKGVRKRALQPSGISIEGRAYKEYGGDPNEWF